MEVHKATAEEGAFISLALFLNVKNAGKLRSEAASGRLGAVLLDPTLIASPFHVLVAANKALLARNHGKIKTKNIFSETIFSLSPSSNISNSFKSFGVKDDSDSMLVVFITAMKDAKEMTKICDGVQGTLVPIVQLESVQQRERIMEFYDIPRDELAISSLENSVVTRLAVKDVS